MATGEVVSRILLSRDKLLRVKQLTVHTSAHLIYHSRLQIQEHGTGYVLSCSSLGEKRVERVIPASSRLVTRHLPIRLQREWQVFPSKKPGPKTKLKTKNQMEVLTKAPSRENNAAAFNILEYRARGSTAPSMHFRPGYRPDRCGSRCTLSWSLLTESFANCARGEGRRKNEKRTEQNGRKPPDQKLQI
jgi:hypothetical protein